MLIYILNYSLLVSENETILYYFVSHLPNCMLKYEKCIKKMEAGVNDHEQKRYSQYSKRI